MPEHTLARFASRTFAHGDFDAVDLARRKREHGTRVSVVIPARNEAATVGEVVDVVRRELVDRVGLVDEVLVVDGDSTDATGERARAAGAQVVAQSAVLAAAGPGHGKGEALWKGLAASTGDLVVFVDADVRGMHPRYVVGLLGPLLADPDIALVKAAYDRPLAQGGDVAPTGGGRVTELMARPLLAGFWPELAWLAQPLAGEYAGRRQLLESLPFVCGYGVELALLIDIAERDGVEVIAQVDLGSRRHAHQPLDALGRMAAEILHVAVGRLVRHDRMVLTELPAAALLQPVRTETGGLDLAVSEVVVAERPPLATWRSGD